MLEKIAEFIVPTVWPWFKTVKCIVATEKSILLKFPPSGIFRVDRFRGNRNKRASKKFHCTGAVCSAPDFPITNFAERKTWLSEEERDITLQQSFNIHQMDKDSCGQAFCRKSDSGAKAIYTDGSKTDEGVLEAHIAFSKTME
ncbi:hypothetical protein AVEN_194891-1 [Araneus ventricosus]|uniref:Uncharacterized protein n=1 Tax=Araneus ventricosus TaxID=182803 RepID=A0A4Y2B6G7_ARAVE|nr:hypothetical protein AVEN_194891-1 [Araneus ventricosus]